MITANVMLNGVTVFTGTDFDFDIVDVPLLPPRDRDNQLVFTVGGLPGSTLCMLVVAVRPADCH